MPETADLIIQITKIERNFFKDRADYVNAHPTFSKTDWPLSSWWAFECFCPPVSIKKLRNG